MKSVFFTLASIAALATAHAQQSKTFAVNKVSPAYVYANTYSFENPLTEAQQERMSYVSSRTSAARTAEDNAKFGYDFCAPRGVFQKTQSVGKTTCHKEKDGGGYQCETPFVVQCLAK